MILVDTHVVLWLAVEERRISAKARAAIIKARTEDGLAISGITLLELTILASKGRIQVSAGIESLLREVEARFAVLPITARVCMAAMGLPPAYPKDPADRIIAATAIAEGLPLITADRGIRGSKALRTVW